MRPELIYIAGPYRAETEQRKQENIAAARDAGAELFRRGYAPLIPHSMTADFDTLYPDIPDEVYLRTDLLWLRQCASMLMLPNWLQSYGACKEHALADELGTIMIYYHIDDVPDIRGTDAQANA